MLKSSKNQQLRADIAAAGVKYWQLAAELNVADATLTRWLRFELEPDREREIRAALDRLREGKAAKNG